MSKRFPNKEIKIILPFGPPGFSSRVAFALQPHLSQFLGVDIVFEHITGGSGGSNGPIAASKAKPDGYTLFMGTIGNISLLPNTLKNYISPSECFTPITKIAVTPNILIARSNGEISNFAELLKVALENPGEITFHGINEHSIHMLEFKSLIAETGIDLKSVPVDGGSPGAIEAIKNGEVDLSITTGPRLFEGIRKNNFIPIAAISKKRAKFFPAIPTMSELGIKSLGEGSWTALFAPKETPNYINERLFEAAHYASKQKDVIETLKDQAAMIETDDSLTDALKFMEKETERLKNACISANFHKDSIR